MQTCTITTKFNNVLPHYVTSHFVMSCHVLLRIVENSGIQVLFPFLFGNTDVTKNKSSWEGRQLSSCKIFFKGKKPKTEFTVLKQSLILSGKTCMHSTSYTAISDHHCIFDSYS